MSLSRGCLLIEAKPGEWFCVVANTEYDYDFTQGHSVYGPKPTDDDAWRAMSDYEANPGGVSTVAHGSVTGAERHLIETGCKRGGQERAWGGYGNLGL